MLISIIIPVYNGQDYISRCLESILIQKAKMEVIIVNDGSNDNTYNICNEYAQKYDYIKVFNIENNGVSNARNVGLENSKGDFIAFVDADDTVTDCYLESAIEYVEKTNCDVIMGASRMIYKDNFKEFKVNLRENECFRIFDKYNVIVNLLTENNIITDVSLSSCANSGPVAKLYSRALLQNVCFDNNVFMGEDKLFNLEVLVNAKKVVITDEIWYNYYQNSQSATKKFQPKSIDNFYCALKFQKKFLLENGAKYKSALDCFSLSLFSYAVQQHLTHENNINKLTIAIREVYQNEDMINFTKNLQLRKFPTKKKIVAFLCKSKKVFFTIIVFKFFVKLHRVQYEMFK